MATNVGLSLNENNDENINIAVTTNVPTAGTALDISSVTIEAYLKASATASDTDPATWKGSTATGEITVTSGTLGLAEISIPASAITSAGKAWWRVDIIVGTKRKTAVYGSVTVVDM